LECMKRAEDVGMLREFAELCEQSARLLEALRRGR